MNVNCKPTLPSALSIAGADSGGGAGIAADLKTFAVHRVHGLAAITAITAQNTRAVLRAQALSAGLVQAQLSAVFDDFSIAAIKTGMLANRSIVDAVADFLGQQPALPLVIDPVLKATSGASLLADRARDVLIKRLFPKAILVTPNIPEAEILIGRRLHNEQALLDAGRRLLDTGAAAVLLKGAHFEGDIIVDRLFTAAGVDAFAHVRLPIRTHGTGCTLAAAITARLALGTPLQDAVAGAIDFLQRALASAYAPGGTAVQVMDQQGAGAS